MSKDIADLAETLRSQQVVSMRVKVIPKSPRNQVVGCMADGTLKIRIAAVPEQGKANTELCSFLAKEFGVHRRNITIISGQTSHLKQIRISL